MKTKTILVKCVNKVYSYLGLLFNLTTKTNKLYYIIHRSSESYLKFIRILIFIGHVPVLTVICVLAIDLLSILKSCDSIPIPFNIRLNISTSSRSLRWKNVIR